MSQTPAFDKPKVSASWGSGSRFQLPVWLVGVGASSLRERTGPLKALPPLSAGPCSPVGCLMRESEVESVLNLEAPLAGLIPLGLIPCRCSGHPGTACAEQLCEPRWLNLSCQKGSSVYNYRYLVVYSGY